MKKILDLLKWQHKLFIFAIIVAIIPALIIGMSLINKTEEELTQSINIQITNIADNISSKINQFFVNQYEKEFLIKKALENNNLGIEGKLSLIVATVGSIDEVVSLSLIFKKNDNYSIAFRSHKEIIDSLLNAKDSVIQTLIAAPQKIVPKLLTKKENFGNPVYIPSVNDWFIYSIIDVKISGAPDAYLLSVIRLSQLQKELSMPLYKEAGKIFLINSLGETIFNTVKSPTEQKIIEKALYILQGKSRVTEISNFLKNNQKYVTAIAFPQNIKWAVIVIKSYNNAYALVNALKYSMYKWLFVGIILALLFTLFFLGRIKKPLNHIIEKAQEISKGNFDIKIEYKKEDDALGILGSTLEKMSKYLKKSFAQIEEQNKKLEEYNRTLEQKVLERTAELKETNMHLQEAYNKVLELNNEKNEFLGIAAHDLKNPLVSIKGFGEIIRDDTSLDKDSLAEFANTIVESSERMFEIITSLLDINKIEEGRIELKINSFFINNIVKEILYQNIDTANKKEIEIHSNYVEPDIELITDKHLLMQVLDNIVSNAIKFSPPGKPIEVTIEKYMDNNIKIIIKDNGPGLSEEDKSKLFKKFAKLSAKPTAGEHSTGLGLSIAKKVIEMLQGNILVESELGKGAKFIIILPKQIHNN